VLPRLAPLCAPYRTTFAVHRAARPIDVLLAVRDAPRGDSRPEAHRRRWPGPARLHGRARARTSRVPRRASRRRSFGCDGVDETLATWGEPADDVTRVLVMTRDAPSRVHDRLGELSGHGRHRVHLCYAARELREAIGQPGRSCSSATSRSRPCIARLMKPGDVRAIAFYLPQFHRIAENDRWWGEGFTEWTNVQRGRPQFAGHYQPHVPGELGYHDLLDPAVRSAQARLAREHGIHGFCYYHYWFNGRRLLERPLEAVLASGEPDLPFCVCWANENWTRRWDGLDDEILMQQVYGLEDSLAFLRSLLPLFRDPRYIRVDDRPLMLVYKAALIPNVADTVAAWRTEARAAGFAGLHLVACQTTGETDPLQLGFDAGCEFPPHGHYAVPLNGEMRGLDPAFRGLVTSYKSQVVQSLERPLPDFPLYRTVMPGWDNTPRRQAGGTVFVGSSPELFGYWVERMARRRASGTRATRA
jgi:hypothetical protein